MQKKIGILGGSFDPPHIGHLSLTKEVQSALGLDKVFFVPTYISPFKKPHRASAKDRQTMVELLIKDEESFAVDCSEMERKTVSYTITTLNYFSRLYPKDDLFLIMGVDIFEQFHLWRNYKEILKKANIVVATRGGISLDHCIKKTSTEIQQFIDTDSIKNLAFGKEKLQYPLKTGYNIYCVAVKEVRTSSSELRKALLSQSDCAVISDDIMEYISREKVYKKAKTTNWTIQSFSTDCLSFFYQIGVTAPMLFDLSEEDATLSEVVILGSGASTKQVCAFFEKIKKYIFNHFDIKPYFVEGESDGRWIVMDYGFVVIHLFYEPLRAKYHLEDLWKTHFVSETT